VIAIAAGTYNYVATLAGSPSGKTAITVTHNPDGSVSIAEDSAGSFQGVAGSAKATLTLGRDDATVTAYGAHLLVGANAVDSSASFAGKTATVSGLGGTQSFTLSPGQQFVLVDGALMSGFIALPSQVAAWPNAPLQLIQPIYGQATALLTDAAAKPVRPADVPSADASLTVTGPVPMVEWYDPATMVPDEIVVSAEQPLVITRRP
jgi:hypothetical protein